MVSIQQRLVRRFQLDYARRQRTIESCVELELRFAVPEDEHDPLPGHDGIVDPGRHALFRAVHRCNRESSRRED